MRTIGIPKQPSTTVAPGRVPVLGTVRLAVAGAIVLVALVVVGAASAGAAVAEPVSVVALAQSFDQVLDNIRNWLIGILAGLATVCLTVAGARYVLASGDPSEVEKSKTALRAACVGYALAMLAPVIVSVLKSIVGA